MGFDGSVATEIATQDDDGTLITARTSSWPSRVAQRTTGAKTVAASRSDAGT